MEPYKTKASCVNLKFRFQLHDVQLTNRGGLAAPIFFNSSLTNQKSQGEKIPRGIIESPINTKKVLFHFATWVWVDRSRMHFRVLRDLTGATRKPRLNTHRRFTSRGEAKIFLIGQLVIPFEVTRSVPIFQLLRGVTLEDETKIHQR